MVAGLMTFGVSNLVVAQDEQAQTEQTEQVVAPEQTEVTPAEVETTEEITPAQAEAPKTFRESIKKQFIDGGPGFMGIVLVILLIGMAISIERIIYLTLSTANSKKLLAGIEAKMKNGDVEGAKQLCKDTRGPVASIFTQGLIRYQDGQSLEEVEKAIVSYGSVAGGKLESGLSWIGLCISLAPMFGFMGTVIGMIQAFDGRGLRYEGRSVDHRVRSDRRYYPSDFLQLHRFKDRKHRQRYGRRFHLVHGYPR